MLQTFPMGLFSCDSVHFGTTDRSLKFNIIPKLQRISIANNAIFKKIHLLAMGFEGHERVRFAGYAEQGQGSKKREGKPIGRLFREKAEGQPLSFPQ